MFQKPLLDILKKEKLGHIYSIKRRVLMSRKYLMDKEIAIYERMKE